MMQYLGNWQFWAAVIIVGIVVNLVMSYVLPKLSGGGS